MLKIPGKNLYLSNDRSLSIPDYQINDNKKMIGLFGSSGSGKSSFLQYIYDSQHRMIPIHMMKQEIHLLPQLTVRETLWYYKMLRTRETTARNIDTVLRQMGLELIADERIGSIEERGISGGEKKRIMLAVALLDPISDVFLLDEPFSGLDDASIERIFFLFREERTKMFIMSIHQFPEHLKQYLDEVWTISSDPPQLFFPPPSSSEFIEIRLRDNDDPIVIPPEKPCRTSFFRQCLLLGRRDYIIARREAMQTLLHFIVPLITIVIQNIFLGSIAHHYHIWNRTKESLDLIRLAVVIHILFFTVSMLPVSMLSVHIAKRSFIIHETNHLFSMNAYLLNAIMADQFWLLAISSIIMMLQFVSPNLFFAIAMEMMFTNMLMWLFSSFITSSSVILLLITSYISISFISNLGFLIRYKQFYFIQWISMIHLQANQFIEFIHADQILPLLNIHPLPISPILLSVLLWAFPILFLCLFDLKKSRK